MCDFLSLVSDGKGNINYFDYEIRKKIIAGELNFETDSHSSIIEYFHGKQSQPAYFAKGDKEANFNKYEYNPLTKAFKVDSLNVENDSESVNKQCLELDFKTIVPELQIKEIINPNNIIHGDRANDSEIALLMIWASVRASVGASVRDSVRASVGDSVWASVVDSVGDSVRASVGDSVGDSVGASVWASVWASVGDSVGASVRDSFWDSVWDSVWAYISSFYAIANWKHINHEEDKNPFQSCIDLWHLGLAPSFDGKVWRLHNMSRDAKVIYEWVNYHYPKGIVASKKA